MIHILDAQKDEPVTILILKGCTVLVSLIDDNVEFCTLKGTDPVWSNNEVVSFMYTSDMFNFKDMMVIKNTLISMMKEFFSSNEGGFLKYQPSCPRRDKIYLRYLEKAGYTAIEYGDNEYLITYPH